MLFFPLSLLYVFSKKNLSNCFLVLISLKGTTTTCLSSDFASAFINDVLPVPGGPCNPIPNVYGIPFS